MTRYDIDPAFFDSDLFCEVTAQLMDPVLMPALTFCLILRVYVRRAMQAALAMHRAFWEEYEVTGSPQAHADARLWYARYLKVKYLLEDNDAL